MYFKPNFIHTCFMKHLTSFKHTRSKLLATSIYFCYLKPKADHQVVFFCINHRNIYFLNSLMSTVFLVLCLSLLYIWNEGIINTEITVPASLKDRHSFFKHEFLSIPSAPWPLSGIYITKDSYRQYFIGIYKDLQRSTIFNRIKPLLNSYRKYTYPS